MRTYSRADYERSQHEWDEFRAGWTEVRRAAQDWSIFPPSGSRWDQWDDDNPTQAAIVARLLDSNKPMLLDIIRRSRSWSQVVSGIIQLEDRLNEDIESPGTGPRHVEGRAPEPRRGRPIYRADPRPHRQRTVGGRMTHQEGPGMGVEAHEHIHSWQANGTVKEDRVMYSPISMLDHVTWTETFAVQSCACGKVRRVRVAVGPDRWLNR